MAVSYEKRLAGKNKDEILRNLTLLGWDGAMHLYDLKWLPSFDEWCREHLGRSCFDFPFGGGAVVLQNSVGKTPTDQVAERIVNKINSLREEVENLKAENKRKDELISSLMNNDYERYASKLIKLVEVCEA